MARKKWKGKNRQDRSCVSRCALRQSYEYVRTSETSQVLTNLVFPVRRKDQPLDKSVFIRKKGDPPLFINLVSTITPSLSSKLHSYPRTFTIHRLGFFDRHPGTFTNTKLYTVKGASKTLPASLPARSHGITIFFSFFSFLFFSLLFSSLLFFSFLFFSPLLFLSRVLFLFIPKKYRV